MKSLTMICAVALTIGMALGNVLCALVSVITYDAMLTRSMQQTAAIILLTYALIRVAYPKDDLAITATLLTKTAWSVLGMLTAFMTILGILHAVPPIKVAEMIVFQAIAVGSMTYILRQALMQRNAARQSASRDQE
jgi:hypothetical protein